MRRARLRALGRDEPGRHGHRAGAVPRAGASAARAASRQRWSRRCASSRIHHTDSVMLGRTLLQPAPPVTFGLKAAGWYAACSRGWARVQLALTDALVLQFGGASGTLAALEGRGLEVAVELGRELGLTVPDAPWHAHRDRLAALMAACAVYVGSLGKIAHRHCAADAGRGRRGGGARGRIVDDAAEAEPGGVRRGTGGGDARARTAGIVSLGHVAAARTGLGGGHAEGPTVAALIQATGAALAAIEQVADSLRVDPRGCVRISQRPAEPCSPSVR